MAEGAPNKSPYRVVSSREVYRNEWLRLREDQVICPDGAPGTFGVVEVRAGASVLALTEQHDAYLVREYKYAIGREALEVASGVVEEGETPLRAAQRELREELGVEAREWVELGAVEYLGSSVRSPTRLFLVLGVHQVREQQPDPGEVVRAVRVPFARALELVERGEITHAPSCVAILCADRYLRQRPEDGGAGGILQMIELRTGSLIELPLAGLTPKASVAERRAFPSFSRVSRLTVWTPHRPLLLDANVYSLSLSKTSWGGS